MTLVRIAIVDHDDKRAGELCRAFEHVAERVICTGLGQDDWTTYQQDSAQVWSTECPSGPLSVLVCFRHSEDKCKGGKELKPNFTVWFGGNGGEDHRHPREPYEAIDQKVSPGGSSGVPKPEQARQLVEFFSSQGTVARPPFLRNPQRAGAASVDRMTALAVLCQGYLAACAERADGGESSNTVKKAVDLMGWADFVQDGGLELLGRDPGDMWSEVQTATWWVGGLGCSAADWPTDATETLHVRSLIEVINSKSDAIEAETVAAAFLELAKRLS